MQSVLSKEQMETLDNVLRKNLLDIKNPVKERKNLVKKFMLKILKG